MDALDHRQPTLGLAVADIGLAQLTRGEQGLRMVGTVALLAQRQQCLQWCDCLVVASGTRGKRALDQPDLFADLRFAQGVMPAQVAGLDQQRARLVVTVALAERAGQAGQGFDQQRRSRPGATQHRGRRAQPRFGGGGVGRIAQAEHLAQRSCASAASALFAPNRPLRCCKADA